MSVLITSQTVAGAHNMDANLSSCRLLGRRNNKLIEEQAKVAYPKQKLINFQRQKRKSCKQIMYSYYALVLHSSLLLYRFSTDAYSFVYVWDYCDDSLLRRSPRDTH